MGITDNAWLYNMVFHIHMKKTFISREKWEKSMSQRKSSGQEAYEQGRQLADNQRREEDSVSHQLLSSRRK